MITATQVKELREKTGAGIMECKKVADRVKVGCVIFDKKKVLSVGRNFKHRSIKKLHPRFQRWKGSVHAEVDAIIHARKDLRGSSILVVRINRFNQLRMAKPCQDCFKYIINVGIRKVFYSVDHYPYIEEIKINGG